MYSLFDIRLNGLLIEVLHILMHEELSIDNTSFVLGMVVCTKFPTSDKITLY